MKIKKNLLATSSTPAAVPTELSWRAPTVIVPVVYSKLRIKTSHFKAD